MDVLALGGSRSEGSLLFGPDAMSFHQARDSILAAGDILTLELPSDPGTAVGLTAFQMHLVYPMQELQIRSLTLSGFLL